MRWRLASDSAPSLGVLIVWHPLARARPASKGEISYSPFTPWAARDEATSPPAALHPRAGPCSAAWRGTAPGTGSPTPHPAAHTSRQTHQRSSHISNMLKHVEQHGVNADISVRLCTVHDNVCVTHRSTSNQTCRQGRTNGFVSYPPYSHAFLQHVHVYTTSPGASHAYPHHRQQQACRGTEHATS